MNTLDASPPSFSHRTILHVDMDAFYTSVEQRDHPHLRGRPVVVGGSVNRGVVSAASYEARKYGIHSAMPMAEAARRCKDLIVMPGRMGLYVDISRKVQRIFRRFTTLVEPLSLDEAFLDVTGSVSLFGDGETIARSIRAAILHELGLNASAGVASNKLVAKMASDLCKPDGLLVVAPGQETDLLAPLSIRKLWGVGPRTEEKLERLGIRKIGDMQSRVPPSLHLAGVADDQVVNGIRAELLKRAFGLDDRPVVCGHEARSMSSEHTFEEDLRDEDRLHSRLQTQAETVARRLRAAGLHARTVTLKVRINQRKADGRYKLLTRSRTRAEATNDGMELYRSAEELLRNLSLGTARIRLIGLGASTLEAGGRQGHLFAPPCSGNRKKLNETLDRITERFGKKSVIPASTLRKSDRSK